MTVWKPDNITVEPMVILSNWSIMELNDGSRHFVGYNVLLKEGRVSSAIQTFDKNTMSGITNSGRVYKLDGSAGCNNDAHYVWQQWCNINSIDINSVRNVKL